MAHTLIVYAHPGPKGHNPFMFEQVERELKRRKESFEIIDLYKDGFDPIYRLDKADALTEKYQQSVKNCDKMIYIYPVWWGSMPAALKGFFDRVFEAGFAFKYVGSRPQGLLKGKKAAVLLTSGAPAWLYNATLGFPSLLVSFGILRFCGIKNKVFPVHKCYSFNNKRKPLLKKNVLRALDWLY